MNCRGWIATDEGIYVYNPSTGYSDILACYHPILPVERFKNLETGEEQIKIAYKRNFKWEEIIVPKSTIASASKIVGLSSRGIAVTSENAKYLVRYLSDVENANEDIIKVQEVIDPKNLQTEAHNALKEHIAESLEFTRVVCGFENLNFQAFVLDILELVKSFLD